MNPPKYEAPWLYVWVAFQDSQNGGSYLGAGGIDFFGSNFDNFQPHSHFLNFKFSTTNFIPIFVRNGRSLVRNCYFSAQFVLLFLNGRIGGLGRGGGVIFGLQNQTPLEGGFIFGGFVEKVTTLGCWSPPVASSVGPNLIRGDQHRGRGWVCSWQSRCTQPRSHSSPRFPICNAFLWEVLTLTWQ